MKSNQNLSGVASMADVLTVELREQVGSKRMRRMRAGGGVPAVLYGHQQACQHLSIPSTQLMSVVNHGGKIVKLEGAVTQDALVREVQWDVLGKKVLHVDLIRVDATERVTATVSVEGKGMAAGSTEGGIVEWVLHEIEIECPAFSVPDKIILRLDGLHLGETIHAKDVPLPEGATLVGHEEDVIVHCVAPRAEEEETAGVVAEPEVIKKEKKEGEEE